MQITVFLELVAEVPAIFDLFENLRTQAVREIDGIIHLQIAGHQLNVAILVQGAAIRTGRQLRGCQAANLKNAGLHHLPLDRAIPNIRRKISGRTIIIALISVVARIGGLCSEIVQIHGKSWRRVSVVSSHTFQFYYIASSCRLGLKKLPVPAEPGTRSFASLTPITAQKKSHLLG